MDGGGQGGPEGYGARRPPELLGLREDEYARICGLLGRRPSQVELGMFAALWSEHCAYKHSRRLLGRFPSSGPQLLLGPGENAGVVDLGDMAAAFRIESHNHPTAVDPYQGAATGAGGIIRDILAVGARPVALLNSVRFGDPADPKARRLLEGAVAGLRDYGNEVGVPAVGGEAFFEPCYRDNPLVNVLCVGFLPKGRLTRARASGVGNALMVIGGTTGRDGILGASFASDELPAEGGDGAGTVQVGDPRVERRLIEACLEILEQPGVVGIQDMGAAGITSSVAETASKAGSGADIDVAAVPRREEGMTPYEVMLSESQERMLIVVERGREEAVAAIARKWDLAVAVIGRVTGDGMLRVRDGGEVVAEVPVRALTEEAPAYSPPSRRPAYLDALPTFDPGRVPEPGDWAGALRRVLQWPNVASKTGTFQGFDAPHAGRLLTQPGEGAPVIQLPGSDTCIALSVDGNGRYAYLDPYLGAAHAVAEAARNVVCTGARPLALTNGLNMGNPEKPEAYWQLEQVVDGIAAAARELGVPVSGGNVSLYNETDGEAIYPTPIIGVLGVLEPGRPRLRPHWRESGLALLLLGDGPQHLGGSEYLLANGYGLMGPVPHLDLGMEKKVQGLLLHLHRSGLVEAAQDVSAGGLLAALVEAAAGEGIGAAVRLPALPGRADTFLFGEGGSRIVVAVRPEAAGAVEAEAAEAGVPCRRLGETGGDRLAVSVDGRTLLDESLPDLLRCWREGLVSP